MKKIITSIIIILSICIITGCNKTNNNKKNESLINILDKYSSYYQDINNYDYQVILSIANLEKYNINYLDEQKKQQIINEIFKKNIYTSITEVYKDLKILKTFNQNLPNSINNFLENLTFDEIESWNYAYAYISLEQTKLNNRLKLQIKDYFNINFDQIYLDVDTAAMYIISNIANEENTSKLFKIIDESLSNDGAISYENPNSCSTSMVILALLSKNIDPTNYKNLNLIEILDTYQQNNAYKWLKTDKQPDLYYATPQCILSMASYYIYKQTNNQVNLLGS